MTKSKWGPAQAPLFFLLSVLALLYFAAPAVAAGGTSLEVRSAAGKAGDTVGVTVSLRGLKNLSGVKGLSGCEFELHYDPATASIKKISKGSIAGSGFMFMENKKYSKKSAKVVLAAASGLITKDGDICNITFKMKKKGLVEVAIKELALYDQDVRALTVGGVRKLPPGSSSEGSGELEPDQDTSASGSGTAVELLPPGDTGSSPEGNYGEKGDAGEPAGEGSSAAASSEKEPGGDAPAAAEPGAVPENSPPRRWLWPAAGLAVLILAAAAFFYIRRRPGKQNNGGIE